MSAPDEEFRPGPNAGRQWAPCLREISAQLCTQTPLSCANRRHSPGRSEPQAGATVASWPELSSVGDGSAWWGMGQTAGRCQLLECVPLSPRECVCGVHVPEDAGMLAVGASRPFVECKPLGHRLTSSTSPPARPRGPICPLPLDKPHLPALGDRHPHPWVSRSGRLRLPVFQQGWDWGTLSRPQSWGCHQAGVRAREPLEGHPCLTSSSVPLLSTLFPHPSFGLHLPLRAAFRYQHTAGDLRFGPTTLLFLLRAPPAQGCLQEKPSYLEQNEQLPQTRETCQT